MKHTRKRTNGMKRRMFLLPIFLVAVVALIVVASAPQVSAWGGKYRWYRQTVEFDETAIFFEYNSTDQDLGLHIFWDAKGWEEVEVKDRNGVEIFEVENGGGLNEIGSTEVFTESAEPALCPGDEDENGEECSPGEIEAAIDEFQSKFLEGKYKFRGRTVDGERLRGSAMLEYALPAAPTIISPEEDGTLDPEEAVIEWCSEDGDAETVRFQVVVEFVEIIEINGEEEEGRVFEFSVDILADDCDEDGPLGPLSVTVPEEFFESLGELDGEYKTEVVGIAASRNATISEREFDLAD